MNPLLTELPVDSQMAIALTLGALITVVVGALAEFIDRMED